MTDAQNEQKMIGLYESSRSGRIYLASREGGQVWVDVKTLGINDGCRIGDKFQWTPNESFPGFLKKVKNHD